MMNIRGLPAFDVLTKRPPDVCGPPLPDNDGCSEWSDGDDAFDLCEILMDAIMCLNDEEETVAACPISVAAPPSGAAHARVEAIDRFSVNPEPSAVPHEHDAWSDAASEADNETSFCSNVSAISAVHMREAKAAAEAVRRELRVWAPSSATPLNDHLGWAWDVVVRVGPPTERSTDSTDSNAPATSCVDGGASLSSQVSGGRAVLLDSRPAIPSGCSEHTTSAHTCTGDVGSDGCGCRTVHDTGSLQGTEGGPTHANATTDASGGGSDALPARPQYPDGLPAIWCCYDAQQPTNRCTKDTSCFHRHATPDERHLVLVCHYGCTCKIPGHARAAAAGGFDAKERGRYLDYVEAMRRYERDMKALERAVWQQMETPAAEATTPAPNPRSATAGSADGWDTVGVGGDHWDSGRAAAAAVWGPVRGASGFGLWSGGPPINPLLSPNPTLHPLYSSQYQQLLLQSKKESPPPPPRASSAFHKADFPCHHCGSENVSAQRFPIFSGNTRRMAIRAVCRDCKRTFAVH